MLETLTSGPLFGLPLTGLWFVLLFALLGTFIFLDGFDFGAGVLFARAEDDHERETLLAIVGPFWDGNEVWLIVFGGAMFAAFPPLYANLFGRHYLLMFAILGALILRGIAPEMYEQRADPTWRRWWGRSFVVGSVLSPFFLGMFAGNWLVGAEQLVTVPGVVVGLALVALCVVDAAAFIGTRSEPGHLQTSLERRGLTALAGYLGAIVLAIGYLVALRPDMRGAILSVPVIALVVATLVAAGVYAWAIRADRFQAAWVSTAGMVYALVAIVALLLYPTIDPAVGLTVETAIVQPLPLNLMTLMTLVLMPFVLSYFWVLYSTFSGPIEHGEGY
ncbi:cytochrome d ubiquinol oxidase subunit II [Halococcoides cellulosivorans]|uniref:Cytochrome D ubiquinol oxidase subunit II n=1 Tax=Halococcoides cellulosivorans TaxID=1679096 RepID=A0A2R4X0Y2_9EURY|nr:cytochrome d ubiquinol oxidase subunit II [Halococcoides cellulosivorans]AWB27457.1 cytochrome D ubiquinol oxidase subunit II [Halococcoides cellulosivorans]